MFEQLVDAALRARREREQGTMSLFDLGGGADDSSFVFDDRVPIPELEFDKSDRLRLEKEMLGLYVSDHPLMGAEAALRRRSDCAIADLAEKPDGETATVGGVVTGLQRKYTKKGDLMAVFTLEDLGGSIEVMVFPKVMSEHGFKLADDVMVCIRGRVDAREDVAKLMCLDVSVLEGISDSVSPLRIRLSPHTASEQVIDELKRLLTEHPGETPVHLHVGESQVLRLPPQFCVDASNGLAGEIRVLLGPDAIIG
ncbi:MAG: hypothetical protein EHM63_02850 [Actinobacteria bacterium]|nr:MAG: hypothetical protein EHM63_02850 [Actinomycetota bacterium]